MYVSYRPLRFDRPTNALTSTTVMAFEYSSSLCICVYAANWLAVSEVMALLWRSRSVNVAPRPVQVADTRLRLKHS